MDAEKEGKRKKDKHSDDEEKRREKRSRKARSRSPPSAEPRDRDSRRKRRHSRSKSPNVSAKQDGQNVSRKDEEIKIEAPQRKARDTDMLNTRTGGAYIPPARLRMMQAQITDKSSIAYQRLAWEALKKSIHGHINKINVGNIGIIIKELLKENIVRGRGLLCRSVIQAQAASPTFTNVYAALVAAVNSRFPNIGELLLKRLVIQFKRGFKRNDKSTCISSASFVAHLVNQRVAHEILALELLTLLVETPTDDSVEVAIAFLKECGQKLTEVSSKGVNAIFEMLRNILHEGQLDKRVQYMIEVMFQVWKDGFKDHPALIEELELVPEEEQFTHLLMLDDATDPQDILNVFKFDEKFEENEEKYKTLCKEILGSDAESDGEEGSGESGSEESGEEDDEDEQKPGMTIIDNTETNLVALRRTIYLTINSSLDFEECAHKLMKMQLKPGQEVELCHMFLDCCAEQRTYEKFYGLLAQRFCNINRIYIEPFEEIFKDSYATAHRLDTNRLRNVSKFFAHLLFTDSISWESLECVKLNEEDTTSSSRIYIKILFQELAEYMGLKKLNDRLKDPSLQHAFSGVFPRDNPKNTRFSINFFTSIGLGGLTDELREHLKQMPKNVPAPITEITVGSGSSSDSESSGSSSSSSSGDSSSSDSSSSDSEEEKGKKKKKDKSNPKKSKNKTKTPATPEEETAKNNDERWDHGGFYETYGKDARRTETRPNREERDRDNFVRPRDRERRYDERNGDDRRRDFDRRYDRGNNKTTESNNRDRNSREYDRNGNEENSRRRTDDSQKNDSEYNRRGRENENSEERYQRRDDRIERDDREYNKNRRDKDRQNEDRSSSRRTDERNDDSRRRDDRNECNDRESYRNRERDSRNGEEPSRRRLEERNNEEYNNKRQNRDESNNELSQRRDDQTEKNKEEHSKRNVNDKNDGEINKYRKNRESDEERSKRRDRNESNDRSKKDKDNEEKASKRRNDEQYSKRDEEIEQERTKRRGDGNRNDREVSKKVINHQDFEERSKKRLEERNQENSKKGVDGQDDERRRNRNDDESKEREYRRKEKDVQNEQNSRRRDGKDKSESKKDKNVQDEESRPRKDKGKDRLRENETKERDDNKHSDKESKRNEKNSDNKKSKKRQEKESSDSSESDSDDDKTVEKNEKPSRYWDNYDYGKGRSKLRDGRTPEKQERSSDRKK